MANELLEEHHSSLRQLRARIYARADGLCCVEVERFVSGDFEHEAPSGWSKVHSPAIMADSLHNARRIAKEELESIAR